MPLARRLCLLLLLCACVLAAVPAARAGLPSCAAAPCHADKGKQVVILDYFRDRHLPRLIRAVKRSGLPGDTPVYYGSYWGIGVNTRPPPKTPPPPRPPGPRPGVPTRRLAPLFPFPRTNYWERRALTSEEEQAVRPGGITGKVPSIASLLR